MTASPAQRRRKRTMCDGHTSPTACHHHPHYRAAKERPVLLHLAQRLRLSQAPAAPWDPVGLAPARLRWAWLLDQLLPKQAFVMTALARAAPVQFTHRELQKTSSELLGALLRELVEALLRELQGAPLPELWEILLHELRGLLQICTLQSSDYSTQLHEPQQTPREEQAAPPELLFCRRGALGSALRRLAPHPAVPRVAAVAQLQVQCGSRVSEGQQLVMPQKQTILLRSSCLREDKMYPRGQDKRLVGWAKPLHGAAGCLVHRIRRDGRAYRWHCT